MTKLPCDILLVRQNFFSVLPVSAGATVEETCYGWAQSAHLNSEEDIQSALAAAQDHQRSVTVC